jgi:hypothetical protein
MNELEALQKILEHANIGYAYDNTLNCLYLDAMKEDDEDCAEIHIYFDADGHIKAFKV